MTGLLLAWVLSQSAPSGPPLVDAAQVVPGLVVDLRYAAADNFLHHAVYPATARCLLRAPVASRLAKVARALASRHLRLKVYDCYRPLSAQREMWKLYPHEGYVANPAKGGLHNRAAAVDLTLVNEAGGELLMPTAFDSFSNAAHHDDVSTPSEARANRKLLRDAMEREGFKINRREWWHYAAPEARTYGLLDEPFDSLSRRRPGQPRRRPGPRS